MAFLFSKGWRLEAADPPGCLAANARPGQPGDCKAAPPAVHQSGDRVLLLHAQTLRSARQHRFMQSKPAASAYESAGGVCSTEL